VEINLPVSRIEAMIGGIPQPLLASILIGCSLFLLGVLVTRFAGERGKLGVYRRRIQGSDALAGTVELGAGDRIRSRLFGGLRFLGEKLTRKSDTVSHLRLRMLQAGFRNPHAHLVYMGIKMLLALSLVLLVLFTSAIAQNVSMRMLPLLTVAMAALGFYLPDLWLRIRTSDRKDKLFKELPERLDLMVVCVESGMGIDQAMTRVADETRSSGPTLSEEFRIYSLEMLAGKSRQNALHNLSLRTGLDEVDNLTTLLIQADNFGTSIAQTLRVFSETFRDVRKQRAQEKAAKLPVKMLFPLLFFIFPALFVVILGPAVIRIYEMFINR
jgi:tight adherence protein C